MIKSLLITSAIVVAFMTSPKVKGQTDQPIVGHQFRAINSDDVDEVVGNSIATEDDVSTSSSNDLSLLESRDEKEVNISADTAVTSALKPEVEAVEGKLFEYELPMVGGEGRNLQIYVEGGGQLPDWLLWNATSSKLEGIPTHDVIGKTYQILIFADVEERNKMEGDKIIAQLSISVVQMMYGVSRDGGNVTDWKNEDALVTVECTKAGSSVTKAIVAMNVDPVNLSTSDKIDLLRRIAKYFGINHRSIIVRPITDLQNMATISLVAGRGNIEQEMSPDVAAENNSFREDNTRSYSNQLQFEAPPTSYLSFQWVIGCGGVQTPHMDVLVNLERTSSNGRLSSALGGLGVVGWYVVNNKPPRSRRSPLDRQKFGRQGRGRHFDVDFSSDKAVDLYAASGDGMPTDAPEMMIPLPVTVATTRWKQNKSSRKSKSKRPKVTQGKVERLTPSKDVYVGRPFVYDLSDEAIFSNGAKDYGISSKNSDSLPPNFWIKINTTSPKLYGFPLDDDVASHEFKISTMTKEGVASMNLKINVINDEYTTTPNHQFCMTLDLGYERFIYDVESRIKVATKLAHAFHSSDPDEMTVLRISDGSVVYTWYNNTLPQDHCDGEALIDLMNIFMDSRGNIDEQFRKSLEPYKLINASVSTFDSCSTIPPRPSAKGGKSAESDVKRDRISSDKLFYMIIGLIVAAAIILVIIFVVVLLFCRHRRKQKHEKKKQLFKSGVPSKGVPVIFAEELQAAVEDEDKRSHKGEEDTARSTLRSRKGSDDGNLNDKKTVPPPEYQPPRSNNVMLKSDMMPIIEGFATSNKSALYNNDDRTFLDSKEPLSDDNHNLKGGHFRRTDPRIRQENRKNQQMIISDID